MAGENVLAVVATFEGHVQGVGFRAQTKSIAMGFSVTGFVQNLADGRVLMEAEGNEEEVDAFLREVQTQMESYLRRTEAKRERRARQHAGFTIRHGG